MPKSSKPRALRTPPTSTLAVVPVTVTDRTCAAVLGLEPRVYREWLVAAGVPHTRIGRRVVARTDHVLAALTRSACSATSVDLPSVDAERDDDDDQPTTPDGVLARIGLRRTR